MLAIFVLGMHRSGTSMTTRVINILGADIGNKQKLLAPYTANQKGYWEQIEIMHLNDGILGRLNVDWRMTSSLPENWTQRENVSALKENGMNIIKNHFLNKEVWVCKDPRFCLTYPFWEELIQELKMNCAFVHPFRNPLAVAQSVIRQYRVPKPEVIKMWANYVLSAFMHTYHKQRVILSYDRFLEDPLLYARKIYEGLPFTEPLNLSEIEQSIVDFTEPNLRHFKVDSENLINDEDVPTYVKETYQLCLMAEERAGYCDQEAFHRQVCNLYKEHIEQ
ncbi:sulfotransferase [Hazenella sp. IB182357]|uniref:Sulfotransferase n=1 Tax=Polycladospora coralii TaxID=2771432 RepID=A0A926N9R9_9BACL|nr:sulfotransferase [Polycladospora coralii]MBD1371560.1 sulfotransferase [Polycladospora coralii]